MGADDGGLAETITREALIAELPRYCLRYQRRPPMPAGRGFGIERRHRSVYRENTESDKLLERRIPLAGARAAWLIATAVIIGASLQVRHTWSAGVQDFDGAWAVTIVCAKAPDGALGYTWAFSADVHNGALLGRYGAPGAVSSGTLSGQINSSGDAVLSVHGLTGNNRYNVGHVNQGTPFHYTANVHFDRAHGTGKRNELRECQLNFVKQ